MADTKPPAQPLNMQQQIVIPATGTPTLYFLKWAQERMQGIAVGITAAQAKQLILDLMAAHPLSAGLGITLTPSGNIADDIVIAVQLALSELTDVDMSTPPTDGQVLTWVGADSKWEPVDPTGGGGSTTLGAPTDAIVTSATPTVNNYIMKLLVVDQLSFTINKIAFMIPAAVPASKFQPFVYACNSSGTPGTLLSTGPQITGAVAGYNEAPLTSPVTVAKGSFIMVGLNVIASALANIFCGSGAAAFAGNGGSSVPSNPAPAVTFFTTYGQVYGFWAVGHN